MTNPISAVPIVDYSVYNGTLDQLKATDKTLINTINQYSYCMAEKDATFKKALQESDVLLPDGMAIVAAVRGLTGHKIKKIAGADVHLHLLQQLHQKGGSCFYLGSSESTLTKIKARMAKDFPGIKVQTYSPPYKPEFSDTENSQMIEAVNAFQPDVVFVGMTAPKQEKWAHAHKEQLDTKVICSIGAVFDFYAGTVERPHPFWIKLRLEWFIRLLKEPKRMWKRYLYYGPVFIGMILKEMVMGQSKTIIEAPAKTAGIPIKIKGIPIKKTGTPSTTTAAPIKTVKVPTKIKGIPIKKIGEPSEKTADPSQ